MRLPLKSKPRLHPLGTGSGPAPEAELSRWVEVLACGPGGSLDLSTCLEPPGAQEVASN